MSINFEERVVAFIDVLGFTAAVIDAESNPDTLEKFTELTQLLNDSVNDLDEPLENTIPKELIPKHISISDSIIISAPMKSDEHAWYDGFSIVVMRCIQLTHIFLKHGYLLRGGISVGKAYHSDKNIYGTAYNEAYKLETKALDPRIVFCKTGEGLDFSTSYSGMCVEGGEYFRVNGLHDYYILEKHQHGGIERVYENYEKIIINNIGSAPNSAAKAKWEKFLEYYRHSADTAIAFANATDIS